MKTKLLAQHQKMFNFTTLLLCSLILIISSYMSMGTVNDNISNDDRLALIAFKNGIAGDPLGILSSWNENNNSLHFCEWRGVKCSHHHPSRVTRLVLPSQGLVGPISPQIGNLSFLKDLILSNNSLNGKVPPQIGRLFRLKRLNLSRNSLEGEIPHNISRCSDLIYLDISRNKLLGRIPNELGYLRNLQIMWLDNNNNLTGEIPASLGNLSSSLTWLDLGYNNLEGRIPNTLSQLTSLKILNLDSNRLSGIVPSSLYNLSSLTVLSLMNNHLHGSIPFDIGITLPNLTFFAIVENHFTGTIPSSFSNMSRLEILQLGTNKLVGSVPDNLGNLKSLEWLHLGANKLGSSKANDLNFFNSLVNCTNLRSISVIFNNFGGVLPSSIANLTKNLVRLDFSRNHIYGSIPTGIHNLAGLTELALTANQLTGSIPPTIGNLKFLRKLDLSLNKLSGSVPSSFGNLTKLFALVLFSNQLTGSIPSSLGYCESLQSLWLSGNKLSGNIPKQLFQLPSLSILLGLSSNLLTGSLPVEVGNLKNLGQLFLAGNKLSGEIPRTIGDCLSLEFLELGGNFFQGNIPPSITFLKGLETLGLSHNNLSGLTPKDLENLRFLKTLDLSFNNLEGDVPQVGVFKDLNSLSIGGNNKLCGGVPDLKLQSCPKPLNSYTKRKQGKPVTNKVIIIIIIVLVLLFTLIVLFLTLHWRNKSKTKLPLPTSDVGEPLLMGVSYNDLLKATNGFNDSTNLIGKGSFGSVYKGILQQDESKPVAVKVIHLKQRGATKSFMAECDALRRVRHRNLLKIITCCSSTDFHDNPFKALVFEFMPNGSLEKWLHPPEGDISNDDQPHERNLNLERRLNIAVDVASALNYLHHDCELPIVHCDVKPSNVLLDDDLTAYVGDFGLAKFLFNPSSNSTQLNEQDASSIAIKGSIGYVSPEYGMGGEVSTQGDVYSYGILLLEIFTGKRPTDDMFKDGLNIHNFCKMHEFPERLEKVIDPHLLLELREDHNDTKVTKYNMLRNESRNITRDSMRQIFASIIQIGVKCSSELASDRCSMRQVVLDVQAIKNRFLGIRL